MYPKQESRRGRDHLGADDLGVFTVRGFAHDTVGYALRKMRRWPQGTQSKREPA